ncbi:MAG: HNH endonuclease [Actinomycetota bacterium]|nr:HNH endonuclease [Actinomycetota bacterium]
MSITQPEQHDASVAERFAAKMTKLPDGCWNISGAIFQKTGYQMFSICRNGKWQPTVAHRVAYELYVGPIAPGLIIDHLCHTWDLECPGGITCPHRRCVNPDHLEPVTRAENNRRGRSPVAIMIRDGLCRAGHEFTGENILTRSNGKRECRPCVQARDRARSGSPGRRANERRAYQRRVEKRKAEASR